MSLPRGGDYKTLLCLSSIHVCSEDPYSGCYVKDELRRWLIGKWFSSGRWLVGYSTLIDELSPQPLLN